MGVIQRKKALLMDYDPLLPPGYKRMKYLESTGTQYILTGLTYTYGYEIKVETRGSFPDGSKGCFGWWNSASQNNLQTYSTGALLRGFVVTRGTNNSIYNIGFPFYGTIIVDGLRISANGQEYTANTISPDINVPFALFGYNRTTGIVKTGLNVRIYYAKFFDSNHNLTGNYIPCLRKSDNVLGMYDTVTKQLYTNSGTGSFIAA